MWSPPPNSRLIAEESVVPANEPPFRWAVFVTADSPAGVITFYTRAMGRHPDEEGCRWREPRVGDIYSAAVYPAEQQDKIPPGARGKIPPDARTLVFFTKRAALSPLEERRSMLLYQDNLLPDDLSPAGLLEATVKGRLVWEESDKGPIFKAGGNTFNGLFTGEVLWVTFAHTGREYLLTVTAGMQPYQPPLRQKDGWFRSCELRKLWRAVETTTRDRIRALGLP